MNIWLITSGEILPFGSERLHRTGMLAQLLAQKGHRVTWWTTTFDHQQKAYISRQNEKKSLSPGLELFLLHSKTAYRRNISLSRLINHAGVAGSFNQMAPAESLPDIIFCSFPTIDLSYEAVRYGMKHNVPVIIDVRDLWPDIFIDPFPRPLHAPIKLALWPYVRKTKAIMRQCTAITAISDGYLQWALHYAGRKAQPKDRVFPLGFHKEVAAVEAFGTSEFFHKKGINPSKTIVWFVGTFGHTYDLLPVIAAAKELEKSGRDDLQFVFTGDGEKMGEWTKEAQGASNIVFTGWVNKTELSLLSGIAKIGLMAYRDKAPQGLPNKIFEYMSDGIPVLSSLQGETYDLLKQHGFGLSYKAGRKDDFTDKLLGMIQNEAYRKQMGENGKRLFFSEFSSEIIYNKLITYLESVIAR